MRLYDIYWLELGDSRKAGWCLVEGFFVWLETDTNGEAYMIYYDIPPTKRPTYMDLKPFPCLGHLVIDLSSQDGAFGVRCLEADPYDGNVNAGLGQWPKGGQRVESARCVTMLCPLCTKWPKQWRREGKREHGCRCCDRFMWQYHINPHQSTSYNITFYAAKSSNQTMMKLLQPRRQISTAKTKCCSRSWWRRNVWKRRSPGRIWGSGDMI